MIVHVDPNPGYTAHVKNDETVHANVNWHSPGQPDPNVEPLSVTNNGTYTAPQGKAYSPVTVNVPHIKKKELSVNSNGTYHATLDEAYDPVVVNVPQTASVVLSVTENGTYTAPAGKAYSPVTVKVTDIGGPKSDVNFYDYDGEVVASYTAAKFALLSELPVNPSHAGLVAEGWNWSLADAKEYVAAYGKLEIGQNYITESGATEIDVNLANPDLSPYLVLAVNGTVSVDWGDGSESDTMAGSSLNLVAYKGHTYASEGTYTISISVVSGEFEFGCELYVEDAPGVLRAAVKQSSTNEVKSAKYSSRITEIRFGNGVSAFGGGALSYCMALKAVSIPTNLTGFSRSIGYGCFSLRHITIPDGTTTISAAQNVDVFSGFTNMKSVSVPKSVTTMRGGVFSGCLLLKTVTLPPELTEAGDGMFANCKSLETVVMPLDLSVFGITTTPADGVFNGCISLRSINIPHAPASEMVVGVSSFEGCTALESLTFPAGLTTIGDRAFYGCYSMQEYHFASPTPPTIGSRTFYGIPSGCSIYVPSASVNAYKTAANWSNYASQIQGE